MPAPSYPRSAKSTRAELTSRARVCSEFAPGGRPRFGLGGSAVVPPIGAEVVICLSVPPCLRVRGHILRPLYSSTRRLAVGETFAPDPISKAFEPGPSVDEGAGVALTPGDTPLSPVAAPSGLVETRHATVGVGSELPLSVAEIVRRAGDKVVAIESEVTAHVGGDTNDLGAFGNDSNVPSTAAPDNVPELHDAVVEQVPEDVPRHLDVLVPGVLLPLDAMAEVEVVEEDRSLDRRAQHGALHPERLTAVEQRSRTHRRVELHAAAGHRAGQSEQFPFGPVHRMIVDRQVEALLAGRRHLRSDLVHQVIGPVTRVRGELAHQLTAGTSDRSRKQLEFPALVGHEVEAPTHRARKLALNDKHRAVGAP